MGAAREAAPEAPVGYRPPERTLTVRARQLQEADRFAGHWTVTGVRYLAQPPVSGPKSAESGPVVEVTCTLMGKLRTGVIPADRPVTVSRPTRSHGDLVRRYYRNMATGTAIKITDQAHPDATRFPKVLDDGTMLRWLVECLEHSNEGWAGTVTEAKRLGQDPRSWCSTCASQPR